MDDNDDQLGPTVTTQLSDLASAKLPQRFRLVVLDDRQQPYSCNLPSPGTLRIGRAETNEVTLEDRAASREHLAIHVEPRQILVEDLGSANGTRLAKKPLEARIATSLEPGEVIEVGNSMLVVQIASQVPPRRRLWSHAYFEARLEDACTSPRPRFSVVRLRVEGAASAEQLENIMTASLQNRDVMAAYAPGEYEVLLSSQDKAQTDSWLKPMEAELKKLDLRVHRSKIATAPEDGRTPDVLMAKAHLGLSKEVASTELNGLVLESEAMQDVYRLVEKVAPVSIRVLLLGETGVGKEVFADLIHQKSCRSGPFISINCAALSETLLESELFGHEKGAFTGADRAKTGLLEDAHQGTVFLDELGEMPMNTQAKLLRALEKNEIVRVGATRPRPIDVRVISATNRDLEAAVEQGAFRRDLYFRLNTFTIPIPPLRERVEDISSLASLFLKHFTLDGHSVPRCSGRALDLMKRYPWPGNVRELRNVMERAHLLCSTGVIDLEHLPTDKMNARWSTADRPAPSSGEQTTSGDPPTSYGPAPDGLNPSERNERNRIAEALDRFAGNQTQAAQSLGIPRRTFTNKLNKYGFPRPRKRR